MFFWLGNGFKYGYFHVVTEGARGLSLLFKYGDFEVFWDSCASLRVRDKEFTVAVDPSKVSPNFSAGIVLITGEGEEYFDKEKLKQVCGKGTCVVAPEDLSTRDVPCQDVEFVGDGDTLDIFGVEIEVLQVNGVVSYRFDMRGTSFFASGGSGFSEKFIEMENRVDVAFLQVAGSELSEDEIVKNAVRIKPKIVVPYHYGEPFFPDYLANIDNLKADIEDRNMECIIEEK